MVREQRETESWPDAVVFDLDGTIADTVADIRYALNQALRKAGLAPLDVDIVKTMVGSGPQALAARALQELESPVDDATVKGLSDGFQDEYRVHGNRFSTLFDGVEGCLRGLTERGVPMGVCTNKPDRLCRILLSDLGILRFFSAIQGYATGQPRKPDPQPLLSVLETLGAVPDRSLYVGDSRTDVLTARAAGVPVALVEYGYTITPASELHADWVLATLEELPALCRDWKLA